MRITISKKDQEMYDEIVKYGMDEFFDMSGCILMLESLYESSYKETVRDFLKNAKHSETESWCLEYVQGYDEENPELGNESWFMSLRLVKAWR